MAEGVSGNELEPTGRRELEPARSKELAPYVPPVHHGHERKFHLTYAVLAGLAVAAVAATVGFVLAGRPPKPPPWSGWKPTASGDAALAQIADHVGANYRLPTGEQLVAVQGGPLEIQGFPVRIVLERNSNNLQIVPGKGALYQLTGLGQNGSIRTGKPSRARMRLLQRESLELALYTFHYVHDVDQVVVLLPPPPKSKPCCAMFFRRNDVKPQLARPLRLTLSPRPPPIRALQKGPAAAVIDRLAGPDFYGVVNVSQGMDSTILLELQPVGAHG